MKDQDIINEIENEDVEKEYCLFCDSEIIEPRKTGIACKNCFGVPPKDDDKFDELVRNGLEFN